MVTLLFGDDATMRRCAGRVLEDRGHEVRTVDELEAAWSTFDHERPPLIVLAQIDDASLELCRRIRRAASDDPMVVAVPGTCPLEQVQAIFEAGADECYTGPAQPERLNTHFAFVEQRMSSRLKRVETTSELRARVQQQAVVAEIGRRALTGSSLDVLMAYAARAVADALGVEYCTVLERQSGGNTFLLKAGAGWGEGTVGQTIVDAEADSQAGYTVQAGAPVIVEDVTQESRFDGSTLLREHDVRSGLSIVITGTPEPYGVLEVHTIERRTFSEDDVHFLQSVANVLAGAVERMQTEQALRESQARANAVLETMVEGLVIIDEQGRITTFNRAAEEIFGYTGDEVLGKNVKMLMPLPDQDAHNRHIRRYLQTGEEHIIGVGRETVGQRKDGSTFPMELSVSEMHIDDRRLFTGIVRDITERKEAEQRMVTQYTTANILAESDSLEEATPRVLQAICEKLDWEWGELWMPDDEGDLLHCLEIWHTDAISLPEFETTTHQTTFAAEVGLPGTVWASAEPEWIPDVTQHRDFVRSQEAAQAGMRGAFAFPIQLGDDVLGVMAFFSREIREPDERLLRMFSVIGNQIGQFAERRRTKEALRKTADRLTRAQEIANLGSWEYDFASDEVAWSDQMYRIYGVDPDAFTPTYDAIMAFIPSDDRQRIEEAIEAARAEDAAFSVEHRIQRPDGSERWVFSQAELSVGADGQPRRMMGTELDVTELKHTRQALQESEARAQAILETTVDAIITIDEYGTIESFNQAAEEIFGYTEEEVLGENVKILMPSPYREEHDGYMRSYRETGRRHIIGIGREVRGKRKDGSTFPMELSVSEVQLGDRRIFTGMVRDITERRRLEKEILKITEQERRRIGQDLHDGLGQMLTGIGLLSQNLARQLENRDAPEAEAASEITDLVKEADQYARDLARGLTPVDLDASGLSAALQRLVANAERLFDIECTYREVGTPEIYDGTTATHLYRIAQEAVSNAVRHGGADHIKISLASGDEQMRLRIHDNGTGFEEEATEGEGKGLRIMNYRARIIGGTLEITSDLGNGTNVTCTLPRTASVPTEEDDGMLAEQ